MKHEPRNHTCQPITNLMRYLYEIPENATHCLAFERYVSRWGGWKKVQRFVTTSQARSWCREEGVEFTLIAPPPAPVPRREPEPVETSASSAPFDPRARAAGDY